MNSSEFILPISLLKTMKDIPKNLEPIQDYPNIYKYTIDGTKYILKTYPIGSTNFEKTLIKLSNFFNETAIQSSIPHPNILPIVGIILTDQNELRPGIITRECYSTLSNLIENKNIDPTFKSYFSIAIIDAISELHKRNLVHGDIKPENIFIDKDDDLVFLPLLADFGSSYLLGDYAIKTGTKFYEAPEIIKENVFSIGKKSDIFSFGLTLLNMEKDETNMRKIFNYINDDDNDDKILEAYQNIPLNYNSTEPINNVITDCCDITPENRPDSEQIYNKIKEGQFFTGTIEPIFENILGSINERKDKLKNEMNVNNIINKFSTLTEYKDLKKTYPGISPEHFIFVLLHLLEIPLFNENEINDPTLELVIKDFESRENEKKAGLQILDLTYNLFNLVKSIDQVSIVISLELLASTVYNDNYTMGKKQLKMPGIFKPILKKIKSDPPKNTKRIQKFGVIKIESPVIEGKTMKFNIISDVKIPFKTIKIRKSDMTISFVV